MKNHISEIIQKLQELQKKVGDLPVYVEMDGCVSPIDFESYVGVVFMDDNGYYQTDYSEGREKVLMATMG